MRRELSSLLITLFLLLSPISFSSEAIPDFTPECPITAAYVVKRAVAPLDGSIPIIASALAPVRVKVSYVDASQLVPANASLNATVSDRAPPA
jgi:hypothetical protein